jgi:2-polyprenyl-3-methyl-5-hydroxy-6-metoxy-1,4-benzoquinol methylase
MTDQAERARIILEDLVVYTKKPEKMVKDRCKYASTELAFIWDKFKDNPDEYYRTTDLYIYDLTLYQSMLVQTVDYMVDFAKDLNLKEILDFGGGIGEYTLRLTKEAGARVSYMDMKLSETMNYAAFRFERHGIEPPMFAETYEWWDRQWDAVCIMDVIEHLSQELADKTLERLRAKAKYIWANPEQLHYNEYYPEHITKYTLEGFERVDLNLYKNKAL